MVEIGGDGSRPTLLCKNYKTVRLRLNNVDMVVLEKTEIGGVSSNLARTPQDLFMQPSLAITLCLTKNKIQTMT